MGNLLPRLRDPLRGEAPSDQLHERIDDVTGEIWICKGDALAETEDNIQRLVQLTFRNQIVGQDGDIMAVDAAGRASVSVKNVPGARPRVNSSEWHTLIDGGAGSTAFATLAAQTSLTGVVASSVNAALGSSAALLNTDGYEAAYFIFGSAGGDNATLLWRVTRVFRMTQAASGPTAARPVWVPAVACSGTAAVGTATYGSGGTGLGATGNRWCDSLVVTSEVAGGFAVYGQTLLSNINMPFLVVDMMGADAVVVEVDENASSTTVDVFGKLGDYPRSMADITLLRAYSHANSDFDVTQA